MKQTIKQLGIVFLAVVFLSSCASNRGYRSVKYKCNSIGCYSDVQHNDIHSTNSITELKEAYSE